MEDLNWWRLLVAGWLRRRGQVVPGANIDSRFYSGAFGTLMYTLLKCSSKCSRCGVWPEL